MKNTNLDIDHHTIPYLISSNLNINEKGWSTWENRIKFSFSTLINLLWPLLIFFRNKSTYDNSLN